MGQIYIIKMGLKHKKSSFAIFSPVCAMREDLGVSYIR
jgi:hypothetical protein